MKNYLATLLILFTLGSSSAFAQALGFECRNMFPPNQQGDERFAKIRIEDGGRRASLLLAAMAGPFEDVTAGLKLERAFYSHSDTSAYAEWEGVSVNLVYFGSWWGAIINLEATAEELELRCQEAAIRP